MKDSGSISWSCAIMNVYSFRPSPSLPLTDTQLVVKSYSSSPPHCPATFFSHCCCEQAKLRCTFPSIRWGSAGGVIACLPTIPDLVEQSHLSWAILLSQEVFRILLEPWLIFKCIRVLLGFYTHYRHKVCLEILLRNVRIFRNTSATNCFYKSVGCGSFWKVFSNLFLDSRNLFS